MSNIHNEGKDTRGGAGRLDSHRSSNPVLSERKSQNEHKALSRVCTVDLYIDMYVYGCLLQYKHTSCIGLGINKTQKTQVLGYL